MRKAVFGLSLVIIMSGATGALAASRCNGDFRHVNGGWIADPTCERSVAQSIATREYEHIARNPIGTHQESRDEFCRGNNDIETYVYCAPYKD